MLDLDPILFTRFHKEIRNLKPFLSLAHPLKRETDENVA